MDRESPVCGKSAYETVPKGADAPPPSKLVPCTICGRKFAEGSLPRHENVCRKTVSRPKTAKFDSLKQRAKGSDISVDSLRDALPTQSSGGFAPLPERPKTAWKERHDDLIRNVKSAKEVRNALKTGNPLPPPPSASRPHTSPAPKRNDR